MNESRLEDEARRARERADEAENQLTKMELLRRSLDGDNQRLKLALNDKETESQARYIRSPFRLFCFSGQGSAIGQLYGSVSVCKSSFLLRADVFYCNDLGLLVPRNVNL